MIVSNRKTINISVRNLVEFILRSGDIDSSKGGFRDSEAMQEGNRIHRKIQKRMDSNYHAEVPLSITVPLIRDGYEFDLCVEGRADGIIDPVVSIEESTSPITIIDEIKGVYMDLGYLENPIAVHRFQVMCYAYIYAEQQGLDNIGIQLTYCNIETEHLKYFNETLTFQELDNWFQSLTSEYAKWAGTQLNHELIRDESIRKLNFPFPYRDGQKELITGVYKTIIRNKKLYIEAPTGVGKTISTIFPTVKAIGEGLVSKVFYLTAKTITRTVAEETYQLLVRHGMKMKVVTITAKDKICILDKPDCNPNSCERAKGHYDRVNDAVYDLLTSENDISRDLIEQYATKHMVCPFEMCLDVTLWSDCIICDYNYAFDPNVYLRRFFADEKKKDYVFLVDEAHNLVERARQMYSAVLYKQSFLEVKRIVKSFHKKMEKRLEACNTTMLRFKRECDECEVVESITDLVLHLMRLFAEFDEFMQEYPSFEGREKVLDFYFEVRHFLNIYELCDEKYLTYSDYDESGSFRITLQCMDPSTNLHNCLEKGRSAVFFSATLLPIQYYKEQLAGTEDDYAVYAPSTFDSNKRRILMGCDVSTKYTRRNESEFQKIADYIKIVVEAKIGNYLVFFPSYQLMNQVMIQMQEKGLKAEIVVQRNNMAEMEREEFLNGFTVEPTLSRIGFCVMGGIFSEGIDLKNDRLIGTIIVGTGLPMVCNERELFRGFYDQHGRDGFDYAYLYPGMNKVLQSAGRVIRTAQDKGVILLLDERFMNQQYQKMFPREWFPNTTVNRENLKEVLSEFWKNE